MNGKIKKEQLSPDFKAEIEGFGTSLSENTNNLATHKTEKISKVMSVTRDLTIAGIQDITGFGFTPKSIIALATVPSATGKMSIGMSSLDGSTAGIADRTNAGTSGAYTQMSNLINIIDSGGTTSATVSAIPDGIRLTWLPSGATGTCYIQLLAQSHY